MDWLTGGKSGEAKRLITQLVDVTKRDVAARDLIGLDADAVPALLEALQTRDLNLLAIYEQILARIPSASPTLIQTLIRVGRAYSKRPALGVVGAVGAGQR